MNEERSVESNETDQLAGADTDTVAGPPPKWSWHLDTVDQTNHTFGLAVGSESTVVALVGQAQGHVFPVQFLIDPADDQNTLVVSQVLREINHYLVELGEPDPWAYLKYHATTASNLYSNVHWFVLDRTLGIK